MNSESTHAPAWARLRQRTRRNTVLAVGAAVLLSGAVAPAFAAESSPETGASTLAAEAIEAQIEVTGWPTGPVTAGEAFTVTMSVESGLVGSPSLAGQLVALGYEGEMIATAALDALGEAQLTVRPLMTGSLELTPLLAGDDVYAPGTGIPATVTVAQVPLGVELIFDESYGVPTAFGGGTFSLIAAVTTECAEAATTDAEAAACAAQYGLPAGTLVLSRDGVELERIAVPGSIADRAFAVPGEDLSENVEAERVFPLPVGVPNILLGTPTSQLYELTFVPSNWFGSAQDSIDAAVRAASTSVEIFVGDDLFDPQHLVYADVVNLVAFVTLGEMGAAPLGGTLMFLANGEPVSGEVPLVDGMAAAFAWEPAIGSAEYAITAVFTPATLNHLASESEAYPLTVVVSPAANPTPDDSGPPAEHPAPASKSLAATGIGSTSAVGTVGVLTAAAGLLLVAGTAIMKRMRRRQS